ncbi:putative Ig domain-containing protein [Dactylosporangium sp. CA-152071]|uniref:putative Ig domain-containing protein n=1 Tax=Dactylosporangium sp. CA-152071 TaxID=3239933 RepID=UPI003D93E4B2
MAVRPVAARTRRVARRVAGLPTGLTLNPSTGVVSGTPTTFQTANVTVTVTDAAGRTARATFFWFVMPF